MIDKLRSKDREVREAQAFQKGELYLQYCQQYDGEDSPEDILRIFKLWPYTRFEGHSVTLTNNEVYTTNLNPEKFDKGFVNTLDHFKINFDTYMGHFYHIPHGFRDIEDMFGIDLTGHTSAERAVIGETQDNTPEDPYDKYEGILIG